MMHTYFLNQALPEFYINQSLFLPPGRFLDKYIPREFLRTGIFGSRAVVVDYWQNDREEIEQDLDDEMRELIEKSPTKEQLLAMAEEHRNVGYL